MGHVWRHLDHDAGFQGLIRLAFDDESAFAFQHIADVVTGMRVAAGALGSCGNFRDRLDDMIAGGEINVLQRRALDACRSRGRCHGGLRVGHANARKCNRETKYRTLQHGALPYAVLSWDNRMKASSANEGSKST